MGEASARDFDFFHPDTNQARVHQSYRRNKWEIHTDFAFQRSRHTYTHSPVPSHQLGISPIWKKPNQACGPLPANLLAFLGLLCRWPWIINSTYSVGHSCWSVAPICQMSWFTHSFRVGLVNFVACLEERVQEQDNGNLLCKPWKMSVAMGWMLNNGWCVIESMARARFEELNVFYSCAKSAWISGRSCF